MEMQNLKKPLKVQMGRTEGDLLGKRESFQEIEDQSLHTGKQPDDMENIVVKEYYPRNKGQINFFDHVQGTDSK